MRALTLTTTAMPLRLARKVIVALFGATVLAVGIALIVLPGPAVVVIPLGLAILGTEFLWARRLLRRVKQDASRLLRKEKA
jgi:tellurite resistance protein TerC